MAMKNVPQRRKGYKAAISTATMERMEEGAASQERGQQRRMVLMACASNSGKLVQMAKESPQVFETMADMVIAYNKHAQALLEVANSALERIAIASEMSELA